MIQTYARVCESANMKITFVTPNPDLSGGIRIIALYANKLKQRGHEVSIVCTPPCPPTWVEQTKSILKGRGAIRTPSRSPSHFDALEFSYLVKSHYGPVEDRDVPDADVVIATWWETAEWVANLSASKGTKVYLLQHYELFDYLPKERVKATWTLPFYKIVVAPWLADIAVTEYGSQYVSCVPNGINLQQFTAPPRTKQARPTVGFMYSPISWKGTDISLEAFKLASKQNPDLQLVGFGYSSPQPDLPLPEGAIYHQVPPQHKLKDIYASCDAWLFSSRWEGFGLPILEAMACRTPVIGTPVGAAPDLLADGAGILVNPEDPEDIARAIHRLCQLPQAEWQWMSEKAYRKALEYDCEVTTDLFENALQEAIQQSCWLNVSGVPL
jgi:glycosyltransferase involved in cell wall biosynthesis